MEKINTCNVLFRGGGEKKLDVFFPSRKAVDACREVVPTIPTNLVAVGARSTTLRAGLISSYLAGEDKKWSKNNVPATTESNM